MECKLITKHTWINFWKEKAGNAQTSCLVSLTEKEVPEVVTGQPLVVGSSQGGTSQKTEIG